MTIELESEFLNYLATCPDSLDGKLPPMNELAEKLGMSVSKLREQIEVARALGWVAVRPRRGIETLPFTPAAAASLSMRFALAEDRGFFDQIEELREVIEANFWYQAVEALNPQDKQLLSDLMERAWALLKGNPVQIPHKEHRELHLTIYSRLDNVFVKGFLQAYWDAYESVGLNVFTDYPYLEAVWNHHQQMVSAIRQGDFEHGHRALLEHFGILQRRPASGTDGTGKAAELELTPRDISGSI
ncbi:MAG: FCD domain-containing protein [Anaerolineales bacterium]|nr:FCD domain-containing protein [Anaerolineales bacterium]